MIISVLLSGVVVALAQHNYDDNFARNKTFPLSAAAMIISVLLSGVVVALAQHNYDDNFARNKTFPLSAAAYADDPERCVKRVKHVIVSCGWWSKCSGFVAKIPSENAIALSFRGTKGKLQLMEIFGTTLTTKRIRWKVNDQYLGQVGRYFHDAFYGIWDGGLGVHVQKLLKDCADCKIWISYSFRVVHYRDAVVQLPYWYEHHSREVFYKEDMKPNEFHVCEGA
ncbi:unnamed protein product [Strongylus vulgaris]|uniref:PLAT domain-containing protein n=1 Tax=Strongylus vulgaris TaxID=40348 RepID=A0A3P7IU95_STRVU|nr:unnamed protein product [Strongylus vulgaris]